MSDKENNMPKKGSIPWWVKSTVLLGLTGVFCYKVIVTPVNMQFDFPSFLALLLALFSVGMAAMFYFKATDSSNKFYDNTYKFTKDIAALLVRIESGFGEKLRNLDETYKGMQNRFDQLPNKFVTEGIEDKEAETAKQIEEKDQIIADLMTKAQLDATEKEKFLRELKQKEDSIRASREKLSKLRSINSYVIRQYGRPSKIESETGITPDLFLPPELRKYIRKELIAKLGGDLELVTSNTEEIVKSFSDIKDDIPKNIRSLMFDAGLLGLGSVLTPDAAGLLQVIADDRLIMPSW